MWLKQRANIYQDITNADCKRIAKQYNNTKSGIFELILYPDTMSTCLAEHEQLAFSKREHKGEDSLCHWFLLLRSYHA
jgi:hypothetical protein